MKRKVVRVGTETQPAALSAIEAAKEYKSLTLEETLNSIELSEGKKIPPIMIKAISRNNFLTRNFYLLYEVLGILDQEGEDMLEYVTDVADIDSIFQQKALTNARINYDIHAEILMNKRAPTKGIKCPRCGSDDTLNMSFQLRSCDEPATNKSACFSCKNKWTS